MKLGIFNFGTIFVREEHTDDSNSKTEEDALSLDSFPFWIFTIENRKTEEKHTESQ